MQISEIKKGIPVTKNYRGPIFSELSKMAKGDYIETDLKYNHIHQYAFRYGMKIKTRKQSNGLLGVWCIKPFKS